MSQNPSTIYSIQQLNELRKKSSLESSNMKARNNQKKNTESISKRLISYLLSRSTCQFSKPVLGYSPKVLSTTQLVLPALAIIVILKRIQKLQCYSIKDVSSIAFVGIVFGQLGFGKISDNYSRKTAMLWV